MRPYGHPVHACIHLDIRPTPSPWVPGVPVLLVGSSVGASAVTLPDRAEVQTLGFGVQGWV